MRFLVDEFVSRDVTEYLRGSGHDVLAIVEAMPGADDEDILARAVEEKRIVITNDKDFGELVFRSGQAHYGVLLLRLKDESASNQVRILSAIMSQYSDHITGQFASVREDRLRIRGGITLLLTEHQGQE